MKNVLSVKNLNYKYNNLNNFVLNNVSFNVKKGEWLTIMGHNGSGKSTMAKLLDGLLFPSSGQIKINDKELTSKSVWEIRKNIGIIFQNPEDQFVGSTVEDDIAFGLENLNVPRDIIQKKVNKILKIFGLTAYKNYSPSDLSGGQKQKVAIASIIIMKPQLIVVDEATSMLDPQSRKEFLDILTDLKEQFNLSIIFITQIVEEASNSDNLLILNSGKIVTYGSPKAVFKETKVLIEAGLDLPFSEKLKIAMIKQGIKVPGEFMDNKELLKWIIKSS